MDLGRQEFVYLPPRWSESPTNPVQFVDAQSASLPGKRIMFLNTDHSGLNKFSGMLDENFALLLPEIQRMVRNGHSIVLNRHRRNGKEWVGNCLASAFNT